MPSRAFFRCRACGEPVVAGAYRCPVCAIDFPAGTPGAPAAPDSAAAVDPSRPERGAAAAPPLASGVPARVRSDIIAARLDSALVAELAPPQPSAPEPERDVAAERLGAGIGAGEGGTAADARPVARHGLGEGGTAIDVRPLAGNGAVESGTAVEVRPRPSAAAAGASGADASRAAAAESLAVVPAMRGPEDDDDLADLIPAERDAAADDNPAARLDAVPGARASADNPPGGLSVAPARERLPARPHVGDRDDAPREPATALVPVTRRRSKAANLGATLVIACIVLAGAGIAAFVFGRGAPGAGDASRTIRVVAADGWVDVPPAAGTAVITADGPFRIRLDGVVYSATGDRPLQVATTPATALAIRTAGGPTVAQVAQAR